MEWQNLVKWIKTEELGRVSENELMSEYTSWRIGGPARVMFWPKDFSSCLQVLKLCHEKHVPRLFLGNGTNLLVADEGVEALVINTKHLNQIRWQDNLVLADAGVSLAALATQAAQRSLQGLEFAIGIPGSLGGAVMMNAGAYGSDISQIVKWVKAADSAGFEHKFSRDEIGYKYRHSCFKEKDWFIGKVCLELQPGNQALIEEKMNEYLKSRREKQPLEFPNGGSVFKNPAGQGAGRYIDQAGLKGLKVGDAQVSLKHANFIVNLGKATAKDVATLIKIVQEKVKMTYGVTLETEVVYWGSID